MAILYKRKGLYNELLGNFREAIFYYDKGLELTEKYGDKLIEK